jgi:hypothetical protein
MTAKTNIQLCQQLMDDAGISGTLVSTVNQTGELGRVVNWIARAVTEIEGLWFNWNFLHNFHTTSLIIGVSDYPAPEGLNFWDKKTFSISDYEQRLDYVDWTQAKQIVTDPEDGDPHTVTVLPAKTLRFYDTPTQILTIKSQYWSVPTVLAGNAAEPAIPEQFRDIIVYKALQYYANYESADESKIAGIEQYIPRLNQLQSSELPANQGQGNINTGADVVVSVPYGGYNGNDY